MLNKFVGMPEETAVSCWQPSRKFYGLLKAAASRGLIFHQQITFVHDTYPKTFVPIQISLSENVRKTVFTRFIFEKPLSPRFFPFSVQAIALINFNSVK